MKIIYILAGLLLVSLLATPTMAQERSHKNGIRAQTSLIQGREIAAPPWSAACMTGHGPTQCDEPMWVYGSPRELSRYKSAF